jgi:formylglycine-generating enzyme required for sulfatase activity
MKKLLLIILPIVFPLVLLAQNNGWTITKDSEVKYTFSKTPSLFNASFSMIVVEGGRFLMGETKEQTGPETYAKPAHAVYVSDFAIGETEVTEAMWLAVMGEDPNFPRKRTNLPVTNISWEEAIAFTNKLSRLTGKKFRLPTEAEWEYAARGGKKSQGFKFSGSNDFSAVCGYNTKNNHAGPVKSKIPNELGLYDMSGNTCEMCSDWYAPYSSGFQVNPKGPDSGTGKVLRGGSYGEEYSRVSRRDSIQPQSPQSASGFRLVMEIDPL